MTVTKLVERVSFRDSDHTYHLNGKRIPSVTGILGNLSKPALVFWSANMAADAVAEHVRGLTFGPEMAYPDPDALADELHHLAKRAHIDRKNKAAAKGSAVHNAIEQFHANFYEATPPEDFEQLAAWTAFIEWWSTSGLTAVAVEQKVVDPDGRYAGRFDLLAKDDDDLLYVCDIKTSNGVYTESAMQNAAYAHALEAEGEHTVAGTKVLWLPAGATKLTCVERDREEWLLDYNAFDSLVGLHAYRKGMDAFHKDLNDAFKAEQAAAALAAEINDVEAAGFAG